MYLDPNISSGVCKPEIKIDPLSCHPCSRFFTYLQTFTFSQTQAIVDAFRLPVQSKQWASSIKLLVQLCANSFVGLTKLNLPDLQKFL